MNQQAIPKNTLYCLCWNSLAYSHKKLPDVFDPRWKKILTENLNKSKEVKNDTFCFGFFIDNELYWNTPNLMANTIISISLMLSETKIYYITQDQVKIVQNLMHW